MGRLLRQRVRAFSSAGSVRDGVADEGLELFGGVVEGLDAALGAAHGHGALDGRDDERRELRRPPTFGPVLPQRCGQQALPLSKTSAAATTGPGISSVGGSSMETAST